MAREKFERNKPHVNIGTIVLCTACAVGTYASTPEGQKLISDALATAPTVR